MRRSRLKIAVMTACAFSVSMFSLAAQVPATDPAAEVEASADYTRIFAGDWQRAVAYLKRAGSALAEIIRASGGSAEELLSVAFPELVRYNILRDRMEITALKLLYIDYGAKYADFSIGPFQMKPSFALNIEMALKAVARPNDDLELSFDFPIADTKAARQARLKRLADPLWQARYLAAFSAVVYDRHAALLAGLEPTDRVAFLSTAYNAGFQHDVEYLRAVSELAFFPDRTFWRGPPHRYADVARWFYERELPNIPLDD